ncbi:hypothetical protein BDV59DRAFT_189327 [Aspergillus ambiguus]|uniref:magnesium transporter CorA family protein n=1 Tax=Aspergillus ambiguus TaxID=176160 RepID=UPI003CCE3DBD
MSTRDSSRLSFYSCRPQKTILSPAWQKILDDISTRNQENVWWVDVVDGTNGDVSRVSHDLSIHPLTTEDIVMRDPREKIEVFRNYYLISLQTLVSRTSNDEKYAGDIHSGPESSFVPDSVPLYILVFSTGVVTFSPGGCDHVSRVCYRIHRMHDDKILSGDWIFYALIDDIVDNFLPYIESTERESEAIEDQVFIARTDDLPFLIPRIDRLRKKITHLIRCLNGKHDVLNSFIKRCQAKDKNPMFPAGDLLVYLGDVQDHLTTAMTSLTHVDEIVARSQSKFLAQLSVNNLRLSLKVNEGLSKVTVLATIFVPLHLVTGMFGMNVEVPGQETESLAWFLGIVGAFIVFIAIACFVAARFRLL